MIRLEIKERNELLDVVKVFATGKLTLKQSDSLCSVLAIVTRDIKASAHRVDTVADLEAIANGDIEVSDDE